MATRRELEQAYILASDRRDAAILKLDTAEREVKAAMAAFDAAYAALKACPRETPDGSSVTQHSIDKYSGTTDPVAR